MRLAVTGSNFLIYQDHMRKLGLRFDPYMNYNFLVEIMGLIVGGFTEVSGLQAETKIEEVKEGGVNDHVHKIPGMTSYTTVSLKKGITFIYSDVLWKWYRDVINGKFNRRDVFILILNEKREFMPTAVWQLVDAYPTKWIGPELKADSASIAIETLELAHDGLKKFPMP